MEKTSYLIYGGGSHSRVVISILEKMDIQISGIFDTDKKIKTVSKIPFLGNYNSKINSKCKLVIAIGDNHIREKISRTIQHPVGTIIDFDTKINKDVKIGEGSQILHLPQLMSGQQLGSIT